MTRNIWRNIRQKIIVTGTVTFIVLIVVYDRGNSGPWSDDKLMMTEYESVVMNQSRLESRSSLLRTVCDDNNDTELHQTPPGPGVETVLIPGNPALSVCIPHKVGSHAWGVFARRLEELYPWRINRLRSMTWQQRSRIIKKAVVVRHPLERLVSAYRMIFQDWCDKDKFIRSKWRTMCDDKIFSFVNNVGDSELENITDDDKQRFDISSVTKILSSVYDEYKHGQDRFIARIWHKYHPEKNQDPEDMFKFSFQEFVRFLVNGTEEFRDDQYVLNNKGVAYHWDHYHRECPVCHELTQPDFVLHMETLDDDLDQVLKDINLSQHRSLFPHTHQQRGGHSSQLVNTFTSALSQPDLQQLIRKYHLDFELFGYER